MNLLEEARALILALVLAQTSLCCGVTAEEPFQTPFDVTPDDGARDAWIQAQCPPVATPPKEMRFSSRYDPADATQSRILPDREADYERALAPLRAYVKAVVQQANMRSAHRLGGRAAARCAGAAMSAWARADALLVGSAPMDDFVRATVMSGLALAYLQVRQELTFSEQREIRNWFARRAAELRMRYDSRIGQTVHVNNHRYWAGLAVGAMGVAVGSKLDFEWGMEALRQGACSVTPEGALPAEMRRGAAALRYQVYALGPLVMLSELATRNGVDGYNMCHAGVQRAVAFALAAADAPALAQHLVEVGLEPVVDAQGDVSHSQFAWVYTYARRFPVPAVWEKRLSQSWWGMDNLGGDMRILYPARPLARQGLAR